MQQQRWKQLMFRVAWHTPPCCPRAARMATTTTTTPTVRYGTRAPLYPLKCWHMRELRLWYRLEGSSLLPPALVSQCWSQEYTSSLLVLTYCNTLTTRGWYYYITCNCHSNIKCHLCLFKYFITSNHAQSNNIYYNDILLSFNSIILG